MLKVLETKSERIQLELRSDPSRSDREIGRICGVDGKTVRAHRAKIPQIAPENSAPLQNSAADSALDENFRRNSALGENSPDELTKEEQRLKRAAVNAANADDPNPHLLPGQPETAIYLNEGGDLVITQKNWPEEDSIIIISAPYRGIFLDKICDVVGVM
jgi:hypothetical protein